MTGSMISKGNGLEVSWLSNCKLRQKLERRFLHLTLLGSNVLAEGLRLYSIEPFH